MGSFFSALVYNYTISLMSVMDRSTRASRQEFTTMFWVMLLVGVPFAVFRQYMGWVSTKPVYDASGLYLGEFGLFPTWGVLPICAFFIEGLLIHVPFYITCYRRLNDINMPGIKKTALVIGLAIPFVGTALFFWFMYKKPYPDVNQWGAPALSYKQKLAEFESRSSDAARSLATTN